MKASRGIIFGALGIYIQLAGAEVLACQVTALPVSFGIIDPMIVQSYSSVSSVSIQNCIAATSFSVSLSTGGSNDYTQRRMVSSDQNYLMYNLLLSEGVVWGDGSGETSTWNGTVGSAGAEHAVYGRLAHQPNVYPGTYTDSIIVTLTF